MKEKKCKSDQNSKKHIVLDLDSTVIYSLPTKKYKPEKHREKAKKFNFHNMDNYYIVFERPHLQPFLDFLFKNFHVSIWTAASQSYALFIIDKIILANKPERKLDYILFSYHCEVSEQNTSNTKNLKMFHDHVPEKYNEMNTFIVDDYDEVYETQPENCIIAPPFKFKHRDSEKDTFLKDIVPLMKEEMSKEREFSSTINKKLRAMRLPRSLG
jgi:TFIIF-interacting CTD phosphatase-like protein